MKALTLRLPDETHERLRREAFEQHTTITALILSSLAQSPATALDAVKAEAATSGGEPISDEMVVAARDELIARINNVIQPTHGTMRAVLEVAEAARIAPTDGTTR